jgi:hypothetical protein
VAGATSGGDVVIERRLLIVEHALCSGSSSVARPLAGVSRW